LKLESAIIILDQCENAYFENRTLPDPLISTQWTPCGPSKAVLLHPLGAIARKVDYLDNAALHLFRPPKVT
jgi:hypothetical protein